MIIGRTPQRGTPTTELRPNDERGRLVGRRAPTTSTTLDATKPSPRLAYGLEFDAAFRRAVIL